MVATTESPKMSPHSAKPRFEVRIIAPFSYRALTSWTQRLPPPVHRKHKAEQNCSSTAEQREAAPVADPVAKSAVAYGHGQAPDLDRRAIWK